LDEILKIRKERFLIDMKIEKLNKKKEFLESSFEKKTDFMSIIHQKNEQENKSSHQLYIEELIVEIEKNIKNIEKENKETIKLCNRLEDTFEGYISFIHQIELFQKYSN
jgi:uncharacterized protein YsxB (DUF464 family)